MICQPPGIIHDPGFPRGQFAFKPCVASVFPGLAWETYPDPGFPWAVPLPAGPRTCQSAAARVCSSRDLKIGRSKQPNLQVNQSHNVQSPWRPQRGDLGGAGAGSALCVFRMALSAWLIMEPHQKLGDDRCILRGVCLTPRIDLVPLIASAWLPFRPTSRNTGSRSSSNASKNDSVIQWPHH